MRLQQSHPLCMLSRHTGYQQETGRTVSGVAQGPPPCMTSHSARRVSAHPCFVRAAVTAQCTCSGVCVVCCVWRLVCVIFCASSSHGTVHMFRCVYVLCVVCVASCVCDFLCEQQSRHSAHVQVRVCVVCCVLCVTSCVCEFLCKQQSRHSAHVQVRVCVVCCVLCVVCVTSCV